MDSETKTCIKCQQTKPIDDYHLRSDTGKRRGTCRTCLGARKQITKRAYVARNREKVNRQAREGYHRNRDKAARRWKRYYAAKGDVVRAKATQRRRANPDKTRAIDKASRARHPERRKLATKRWVAQHNEHINAYRRQRSREKYASDPVYRLKALLRGRYGSVFRKAGLARSKRTMEMLGCTVDEYVRHVESQFSEGMCWANMGRGIGRWQIDHIKAVCLFDLTDPEQQKACFHYTNLRPLWHDEHLAKTREDMRQFYLLKARLNL